MKVNFYISCETDEEMQECLAFMKRMTDKRAKSATGTTSERSAVGTTCLSGRSQDDDDEEPMQDKRRANVDPGPSSITKIGASTKDTLINMLNADQQPAEKMAEHLKLLWHRGEVKYDGSEWYV